MTPSTEPSLAEGCAYDDECPDHTACENRLCINPCAYQNPCAPTANCQVIRHKPVCSCPDGYIGSPTTSCTLRNICSSAIFEHNNLIVCLKNYDYYCILIK